MEKHESPESPFHEGEKQIQQRLGVGEKMESLGRRYVRKYMPEQHQGFYQNLPYVFIGYVDDDGWPRATIVTGKPGFIRVINDHQLTIGGETVYDEPIRKLIKNGLKVGMLGIELHTRRRNRLNGKVVEGNSSEFTVNVDQTYGNCPQYIQKRELIKTSDVKPEKKTFSYFSEKEKLFLEQCDTFFVASSVNDSNDVNQGVDVSHRGGKPGFIRINSERSITVPDYLGNFHFNTLGNFLVNPKAGLLFIDFVSGDIMSLVGKVQLDFDSKDIEFFRGAERLWHFELEHGYYIRHALPYRWSLEEFSPNSLMAGNWNEAAARQKLMEEKRQWFSVRVKKIEQEGNTIKSFYLFPEVDNFLPDFLPGQFITIKHRIDGCEHSRTYTLSNAPEEGHYRISVKAEYSTHENQPNGVFSIFLHEQVDIGQLFLVSQPSGEFVLDCLSPKPAVLIAGGIGITPMVGMIRHAVRELVRTRHIRPITLIALAKTDNDRAFFSELEALSARSNKAVRILWGLTQEVRLDTKRRVDFIGRITQPLLKGILGNELGSSEFFLCGPSGFMQSVYDNLQGLGIADTAIRAEAFGPASLTRSSENMGPGTEVQIAEQAVIELMASGVELHWSREDGNLLEFIEAHGMTPSYGCRNGQCGSCRVELRGGEVAYAQMPTAALGQGEVLLCCAMPAASEGVPVIRLKI